MKSVAVFYHCAFTVNSHSVKSIIRDQMREVNLSGLADRASTFVVGVNGTKNEASFNSTLFPEKATIVAHGPQCFTENRTIVELEEWLKDHPGWDVLYFHTKGASRPKIASVVGWRKCMMLHLVSKWRRCLDDLSAYESVGCHWFHPNQHQTYWAGNFWWATSDFLRTLPSIHERATIKKFGVDDPRSRFEAEVWIGNGSRLPRVKDYHKGLH